MEIFTLVFSIILFLIICYIIFVYNSLVGAKNNIEENFSTIDSVLQNRYDLIPNLVEVVKKYSSHENEIFSNISKLRSELLKNEKSSEKARFDEENQLFNGMKSVFAIAENYPELKSSANFLELQEQWSEIENRLQAARRSYNSAVKELNIIKESFPSNLVAKFFNFKKYEMFVSEEEAKKSLNAKNLFNS